jgi:Na+-driven multidrug efflux pump
MLAISTPMVVSHACETLLIFIDRLFLSRIGPEPMNAAMAGGLSSFMLMTFFVGLIGYTTALVAQYLVPGVNPNAQWWLLRRCCWLSLRPWWFLPVGHWFI